MKPRVPEMMPASVLQKVGLISLETRPVPRCGPDEVLIQVGSVGVCGSDVHYYEHGRIGPYVVDAPVVLGHEAGGTIVAVGAEVPEDRIGERVAIEPQRPCRLCDYCKSGRYNLCPRMEFLATPPIDGAFCEYIVVPADFAFPVPETVSDHAAALIEPLSVGIAAAQKGGIGFGGTVLIAGAGPIGLMAAQVARAFGATSVIVSDIDPLRREVAHRYGATHVFDAADPVGVEVDVFIDASGATPAILAGLEAVKPGGSAVLVGSAGQIPLDVSHVAMNEINLTGTFRYTNTWPIAIQLLADGAVEVDSLVTHVYGLEQVEDALTATSSTGALKRIVRPRVRFVEEPGTEATSEGREAANA